MRSVVVAALAVCGALAAASPARGDQCADARAVWQAQYARLGGSERQCFDAAAGADMAHHSFKCEDDECMRDMHKLIEDYFATFVPGACGALPEQAMMAAIKEHIGMCNKCLVEYDRFVALEAKWTANGCDAVLGTAAVCTVGSCAATAKQLYESWALMIPGGLCHEYNPGSCGAVMPQEEGDVYNRLYAMSVDILVYQTIPNLCSETCKPSMLAWYSEWAPLLEGNAPCLQSSLKSVDPYKLAQSFMTLQMDCAQSHCATQIQDLETKVNSLRKPCNLGMPAYHRTVLAQARDARHCENVQYENSGSIFFRYGPVVGFFLIMSLLSLIILVVYFFIDLYYNRYVRKLKGWNQIPNVFWWKSCCGVHRGKRSDAGEAEARQSLNRNLGELGEDEEDEDVL